MSSGPRAGRSSPVGAESPLPALRRRAIPSPPSADRSVIADALVRAERRERRGVAAGQDHWGRAHARCDRRQEPGAGRSRCHRDGCRGGGWPQCGRGAQKVEHRPSDGCPPLRARRWRGWRRRPPPAGHSRGFLRDRVADALSLAGCRSGSRRASARPAPAHVRGRLHLQGAGPHSPRVSAPGSASPSPSTGGSTSAPAAFPATHAAVAPVLEQGAILAGGGRMSPLSTAVAAATIASLMSGLPAGLRGSHHRRFTPSRPWSLILIWRRIGLDGIDVSGARFREKALNTCWSRVVRRLPETILALLQNSVC